MRGYRMTERGIITAVVLIVLFLFVIPSIILAIKAAGDDKDPPPENPPRNIELQPETRPEKYYFTNFSL